MRLNYIDCIDCLEGLKEIPDKSVDLVVTDPPYGIGIRSAMNARSKLNAWVFLMLCIFWHCQSVLQ